MTPEQAEAWVRAHIVEIAEAEFPDDAGLAWTIHAVRSRGDLLFVEVEPAPDQVGYARFQLVFRHDRGVSPAHVATYGLESGRYSLLSTAPAAPSLPDVLD